MSTVPLSNISSYKHALVFVLLTLILNSIVTQRWGRCSSQGLLVAQEKSKGTIGTQLDAKCQDFGRDGTPLSPDRNENQFPALREAELAAQAQYTGENGAAYWEWQSRGVDKGGKITALLFSQYTDKSQVILDFGCGSGTLLQNLEAKDKWCVEVNPQARKYASEQLGITRVSATIEELKYNKFDTIISNHALEHTPCPLIVLLQLKEKLKIGGKAIFYTPSLQDELINQKTLAYGETAYDKDGDNNHHLYAWSSQQLANLFNAAGYDILEARTKNFSRTAKSDAAWDAKGAKGFWEVATEENRHPQTMVIATKTA